MFPYFLKVVPYLLEACPFVKAFPDFLEALYGKNSSSFLKLYCLEAPLRLLYKQKASI